MRRTFVLTLAAVALTMFGLASAIAGPDDVCPPLDSGKIDVSDSTASVYVEAPEGYLISGYCAKAGPDRQGLGPEFVTVDPPAESLTIVHSSGKDVSHYSVAYVEVPPTTTTTTTVPPEEPPVDTTTTTVAPPPPVDTTTTTVAPPEPPQETTTTTVAPAPPPETPEPPDGPSDTPEPPGTTDDFSTTDEILPVTGAEATDLIIPGLGLILAGALLVAGAFLDRRSRRT